MKTLIVDYGLCNIDSVKRAVEECGGKAFVTDNPADASTADHIILPGVGNYNEAMRAIRAAGWDAVLRREVLENQIPLLGICLGMQLLSSVGMEGGETAGLDLIPGKVVLMSLGNESSRVPHVGWNEVVQPGTSRLFEGIRDRTNFYFVHSYHFVPQDSADLLATVPYCGGVAAAVGQNNIFGVQFHPEKSLQAGFRLLKNFLGN